MKAIYKQPGKWRASAAGATCAALTALTLLPLSVSAVAQTSSPSSDTAEVTAVEGVVFSAQPETLFAPVREVAERLGWQVHWDSEARKLFLNGREVPGEMRLSLPDGTQAIALRSLQDYQATVAWDPANQTAQVRHEGTAFPVRAGQKTVLEGVTFAGAEGELYAPVRAIGQALDWSVHWDKRSETIYLGDSKISGKQLRSLPDGTQLVSLRALEDWDAKIAWKEQRDAAQVVKGNRAAWVREGEKRVAINRDAQQMRAWQGNLLVLDTRVSTGRPDKPTPTGSYTAGPLKTPMLISRTYGDAKMPWSVQIRGDYVIHGFKSVPPRAASHGCVRVPLTGENPAKWFYEWVEIGTPIAIEDSWPNRNVKSD